MSGVFEGYKPESVYRLFEEVAKIPRDRVVKIDVTDCDEQEAQPCARFSLSGPVSTVSPTGKDKTFSYRAVVDVREEGCTLVSLKVIPLE